MGNILIDQVRIDGFRGLTDFKMFFSRTTVLTGTNNVGKTSVLKALQLVFGTSSFLTSEDFHLEGNNRSSKITIDIRIIPVDNDGTRIEDFDEDWAMVFKSDFIERDAEGYSYIAFRTTFSDNEIKGAFTKEIKKLIAWEQKDVKWLDLKADKRFAIPVSQMPFFYIDAQRDILDDIKSRNSFIGRMLSHVAENYSKEQIGQIESLIEELNQKAIKDSNILSNIKEALSGLNSAMDKIDSTVKILPFAKKIRDLNKSLSIQYGTEDDSFTMDYHGMGTRSWSSLLTFKAFLKMLANSIEEGDAFCPIIAIEEPESHLHPNAQKQLFDQMQEMFGIKIISTHSPYVASSADLSDIRGLYKKGNVTIAGCFNDNGLDKDEIRKVKREVIQSHGELLFSKVIVLFEGETEAQALPIFADNYFGKSSYNYGVNFVGVGGSGFYAPYIRFATAYNIPWFIFSDGETRAKQNVLKCINKALKKEILSLDDESNIFVIPDGKNYEGYITSFDYLEAFRQVWKNDIAEMPINEKEIKYKEIDVYTMQDYYTMSMRSKTSKVAPMAYAIVESGKGLPPLVVELFEKIKETLEHV